MVSLAYEAETRSTMQKICDKVNAVEMDYWGRCIQKIGMKKVRDEGIRKEKNVKESKKA